MIPREKKFPRDYEVMDQVMEYGDAVEYARRLSRSPQHVNSWCRPPKTDEDFSSTGKFGPLAHIRTLISMIKEDDGEPDRAYPIGRYIAGLLSGVFVPLPAPAGTLDSDIMRQVAGVLRETGEAVEATRVFWFENTPGKITERERAVCVGEIDEALVALSQLRHWVEAHSIQS